jgi:hypothetical protein
LDSPRERLFPGLDGPPPTRPIAGYPSSDAAVFSGEIKDWEIPYAHIARWTRALQDATKGTLYPESSAASQASTSAFDSITNRSLRLGWSAGDQLTASNVVPQLERKENSVVSDRVAIIANSCLYTKRLDIPAIAKADCHLSMCALVMAIINGEVNPWPEQAGTDYRLAAWLSPDREYRPLLKRRTLDMIMPEFLVLWNRTYGCRSDVYADNPRLPGVRIGSGGFYTKGWLWDVDQDNHVEIDPTLRSTLLHLLKEKPESNDRFLKDSLNTMCVGIYEGFLKVAARDVADSFWRTLHGRPPVTSPPRPYVTAGICLDGPPPGGGLPTTDVFGNSYIYGPEAKRSYKVKRPVWV